MSGADKFVGGDWNVVCDVSGKKIKASRAMKRWDNAVVDPAYWELRHPQDFVKGVRDDQSVPYARPQGDLSVATLGDTAPGVAAQADFSKFGQDLNANFAAAPVAGAAPLTVRFRDASSGEVRARSWSFGDNTSSAQIDPIKIYSSTGSFTVTLTVIGPEGIQDVETKTDFIITT